jgi:hypothetical protein
MVERDDHQLAAVAEQPVQAHGPGEMAASEPLVAGSSRPWPVIGSVG